MPDVPELPGMAELCIVDLSDQVSGAYAARLFAAAGAEVTLVEPPTGSALRRRPPLLTSSEPLRSAAFEYLSAWKRGVALDWESEPGAAAFGCLLDRADIVISTMPTAQALEFDRRVRSRREHLIHVSATSYGLSGPWAGWRSSDLTDWAASGYLYITGDPAREPLQGAGPWAGYVAGVTAAVGGMAALFARRATGRGQLVDVSAMESMASSHQWSLALWSHQGRVKHRALNRHAEAHYPISLFPVSDGWVCIAAPTLAQWVNLCIACGIPEWADDPRFGTAGLRYDAADEIDRRLEPVLSQWTRAEAAQVLQDHHVPASAVLSMDEVLVDEQLQARAYWAYPEALGEPAKMPGLPFQLPSSPTAFRPAPSLGEHTAAVLSGAGCSAVEIAAVLESGAGRD